MLSISEALCDVILVGLVMSGYVVAKTITNKQHHSVRDTNSYCI